MAIGSSFPLVDQNTNPPHFVVELVTRPPEPKPEEKVDSSPSTKNKMIQIAAYALFAIGALFLVASLGLFGMGLFLGAATLTMGETLYPFGILSMIAGAHLIQDKQKPNNPSIKSSVGFGDVSIPFTVTV